MPNILPVLTICLCLLSPYSKAIANNKIAFDPIKLLGVDMSAHWLTKETIALPAVNHQVNQYQLIVKKNEASFSAISLQQTNNKGELPKHLQHLATYQITQSSEKTKQILKSPIAIYNQATGKFLRVQTSWVLDSLYTSSDNDANEVNDLGATIVGNEVQFKLWAPTATKVEVLLFDQNKQPLTPNKLLLQEDSQTGIWQLATDKVNAFDYYQYQITLFHPASGKVETLITTDPYSLSLSTNSRYTQIVDLANSALMPNGWQQQVIHTIENPEDNIFYETHIYDFSAVDKKLSSEAVRGKYGAFSETNSDGINHLKALKLAGINNIHLLPTFDIGTVNEQSNQVVKLSSKVKEICEIQPSTSICSQAINDNLSLNDILTRFDPRSDKAQALVTELKAVDDYNWGYDPFHYTVPEGSYAQNPEGSARIKEFREMVQSIHQLGFRVIMDVVYNHTHQAGLKPTAVLDKIVPNYYQRLHPVTGKIEQSTCCDNTATERAMMEKLMIDSLVVWARDYKIDGFRFDLMAHQPKAAMLKARNAVQAIDPDNYFYGEGWNFGEVANNRQFVQASQLELSGSEIGTFTDRLRDAVRGGSFSASGIDIRKSQGIGNGLATNNNETQSTQQAKAKYLLFADQLRIGLAGNLANFPLINSAGKQVTGKDIPYGNQPSGYALDPADTINYVSKHDNQTLWDNNQYRLPYETSTGDRVRYHLLSLAYPILAQGIPFLHMGSELLRSKSFLRDSYDYSNWFNKVDFSGNSNNYNVGLPAAEKDQANWPLINELLTNNQGRDIVNSTNIKFAKSVFLELIKIRMSSPLFRLTTANDIIERVSFRNTGKNQQLGVIAMQIDNETQPQNIDKHIAKIMVIFNSSNETKTLSYENAAAFKLHPVLQKSVDTQVKQSIANSTGFVVPALTTAVFIKTPR